MASASDDIFGQLDATATLQNVQNQGFHLYPQQAGASDLISNGTFNLDDLDLGDMLGQDELINQLLDGAELSFGQATKQNGGALPVEENKDARVGELPSDGYQFQHPTKTLPPSGPDKKVRKSSAHAIPGGGQGRRGTQNMLQKRHSAPSGLAFSYDSALQQGMYAHMMKAVPEEQLKDDFTSNAATQDGVADAGGDGAKMQSMDGDGFQGPPMPPPARKLSHDPQQGMQRGPHIAMSAENLPRLPMNSQVPMMFPPNFRPVGPQSAPGLRALRPAAGPRKVMIPPIQQKQVPQVVNIMPRTQPPQARAHPGAVRPPNPLPTMALPDTSKLSKPSVEMEFLMGNRWVENGACHFTGTIVITPREQLNGWLLQATVAAGIFVTQHTHVRLLRQSGQVYEFGSIEQNGKVPVHGQCTITIGGILPSLHTTEYVTGLQLFHCPQMQAPPLQSPSSLPAMPTKFYQNSQPPPTVALPPAGPPKNGSKQIQRVEFLPNIYDKFINEHGLSPRSAKCNSKRRASQDLSVIQQTLGMVADRHEAMKEKRELKPSGGQDPTKKNIKPIKTPFLKKPLVEAEMTDSMTGGPRSPGLSAMFSDMSVSAPALNTADGSVFTFAPPQDAAIPGKPRTIITRKKSHTVSGTRFLPPRTLSTSSIDMYPDIVDVEVDKSSPQNQRRQSLMPLAKSHDEPSGAANQMPQPPSLDPYDEILQSLDAPSQLGEEEAAMIKSISESFSDNYSPNTNNTAPPQQKPVSPLSYHSSYSQSSYSQSIPQEYTHDFTAAAPDQQYYGGMQGGMPGMSLNTNQPPEHLHAVQSAPLLGYASLQSMASIASMGSVQSVQSVQSVDPFADLNTANLGFDLDFSLAGVGDYQQQMMAGHQNLNQ